MEPINRDYFNEAHSIAMGTSDIKPKKEHVIAAMSALWGLQNRTQKLREVMIKFHEQSKKKEELKNDQPKIGE